MGKLPFVPKKGENKSKTTDSNFDWMTGFDRNLLLSKLNACRKIAEGRCSFDAVDYQFWLPILTSAVRAKRHAAALKSQCVQRAVNDPLLPLNDPEAFIRQCNELFRQFSSRQKQRFVLLCHITYTGPKLFASLKSGGCRVAWQPTGNSRFIRTALKARSTALSHILQARGVSTALDGLTALLVHVDAHDYQSAQRQAVDAVDRIRGLLNLIVNRNRRINPFYGLTKPHAVNRLRLGPYQTLHKPDGSLAIDMFWYEARWSHEIESPRFKDAERTRKNIFRWWSRAIDNPLHDLIADGLLRYCRPLDQHDTDAALLGLWGALEALTGTQNATYEVTVNRIVRLFGGDHVEARQIAQHIRLRRNATIHTAQSPSHDEVDAILFQAELLASQVLHFCIWNGRKIESRNDLNFFLDLAMDQKVLKRQQAIMGHFIARQNKLAKGARS